MRKHHEMMNDHQDHLRAEHKRHGHRIDHESMMHHGMYKHEEERPKVAPKGHMMHGLGADDFKKEAMDIAYGQAGMEGCRSDSKKIMSQMKTYVDDSNSGY